MNGQTDPRFLRFSIYVNFSYELRITIVVRRNKVNRREKCGTTHGLAVPLISLNEGRQGLRLTATMDSPEEYRLLANDLRRLATESGALARRAKLFILAEQFEELANDFEKELVHRMHLHQSMAHTA